MRPVREFRANFSEPAKPETGAGDEPDALASDVFFHDTDSTVRNVCFLWENGRKAFFNYAYLAAADLTLLDGLHVLLLSFGSHTVVLRGYGLETLFDALLEHRPRTITAINPRYLSGHERQGCVVTEILVKSE